MGISEIKKKIENLARMSETEVKQTVLEAMSMTQSWLKLSDLKRFFS